MLARWTGRSAARCVLPLLLLAQGCSGSSSGSSAPPAAAVPSEGSLVLDWTISGTTDPSQCTQGVSTTLDVTIDTTSGDSVGEFQADCSAFATSIALPEGRYTANAALLDSSGAERTTEIDVRAFTIRAGESLDVPIDFPASSFH